MHEHTEVNLNYYKIISTVADVQKSYKDPLIKDEDILYQTSYKFLSKRFQYFLQDLETETGQQTNGLIVCDNRSSHQDERLRKLHQELVTSKKKDHFYKSIIEGLFIAFSHYSLGIQFADLVAGAIYRKFETADDRFYQIIKPLIMASNRGAINGYGIVIF